MNVLGSRQALRICAAPAILILLCIGQGAAQVANHAEALEQYRAERSKAAHRARRIIFNNDGDDHLLGGDASLEAFFAKRTTPLLGSQVDTIFYCTSRPFGMFIHNTKVGDVLTDKTAFAPDRNNIVSDLIAQGTDPLSAMVDYCRTNDLEIFWSMRMNDTHDAGHPPGTPQFYWSSFKQEHPEYLFGTRSKRPAFGSWSAVDYAEPVVRDFLFDVFQEICRNYDVDGIELDFYRHLVLFRTVANGGIATPEERDMMTALLRRVREMTEAEGVRCGRPILIAVRAPDSVEYCRGMGIDIEQWMDEGLIDMLVAGGDFRLNPWEVSTALGRRYDIPVYADLDPSIPYNLASPFGRNSLEASRGRAMDAWRAGCAGMYMFNHFNPRDPLWWELGDPESLRRSDKLYFVNVTGSSGYLHAGRSLPGGDKHVTLPRLHPRTPAHLVPGKPLTTSMYVGEDIAGAAQEGLEATVTCHLSASVAMPPEVTLNDTVLTGGEKQGNWFEYAVSPELVRPGANAFQVSMPEATEPASYWDVDYKCDEEPPITGTSTTSAMRSLRCRGRPGVHTETRRPRYRMARFSSPTGEPSPGRTCTTHTR